MTAIKTLRAFSGHDKGATIDVSPSSAAYLIAAEYAEPIEGADNSKPNRGRPRKTDDDDANRQVGNASPSGSAETAG